MILRKNQNNHNINKINTLNTIDKLYEKDEYKNKLFKTQKVNKPNYGVINKIKNKEEYLKNDLLHKIEIKDEELKKVEQEGIKKRVNNPYKGIIKKFDYDKKITKKEELVVHIVTDEDKKEFYKDMKTYKDKIKEQDDDNKNEFSDKNKEGYEKKFQYVQKYKYSVETENCENTGDNLRSDRIDFYKKEKNLNNTNVNNILNELVSSGAINENFDNVDLTKIDIDFLRDKIKSELNLSDVELEALLNG